MILAIRAHALTRESGLLDYVRHYMAFVERCQRSDGRFRNFMDSNGAWLEELGSPDSHGRAVWALGFAARCSAQTEIRLRALRCLDAALPWLAALAPGGAGAPLRSQAFALLGLMPWRRAEPSAELDALAERLAANLAAAYRQCAGPGWRWFEDELTYCNARLPEALLGTAHADIAIDSLAWLCQLLEVDGYVSLIGNRGWYRRGAERAVFDQQPVDAGSLVSACAAAFRLTGEERFRRWAELGFAWFQGKNALGLSMVAPDTGGCFDGLEAGGVNLNQGAESLLAWLLACEDMAEMGRR